ncbi:MAG: ATP-binding cassette domain-containing protein [Clostridia bacterium]|nr:ATP-binding cassette domain-containing protein [Clostridia bacterium]
MGHTILVLEHRLYYLHDLMDRFVVMEEGVIQKEIGKDELPSVTDKQLASMGLRGFHPTKLPHSDIFINCDEQIKQAALLELTHLSFQYDKKEKAVFEKLNLKMRRGEIVALVGDNGVGKTTFAKVLTGLLKEQSGAIRINERNVNQKQRLKEIYYVLQDSDYQLFAESVENELLMKTELTEKKKNEMEYLLSEFELEPYKKCHPMALSRGQKQRVTIAAAMMSEAKILVLDEPSSGLDGDSMRKLAMLITKIAHTGKAVLIISHDVEFIEICCQRVVELKEGGFYEQTI